MKWVQVPKMYLESFCTFKKLNGQQIKIVSVRETSAIFIVLYTRSAIIICNYVCGRGSHPHQMPQNVLYSARQLHAVWSLFSGVCLHGYGPNSVPILLNWWLRPCPLCGTGLVLQKMKYVDPSKNLHSRREDEAVNSLRVRRFASSDGHSFHLSAGWSYGPHLHWISASGKTQYHVSHGDS